MARKDLLIILIAIMAVFSAGCTTPSYYGSIKATIDVPSSVYADQQFSAYIDVSNEGNRTYTNVRSEFFNTGSFEKMGDCSVSESRFTPLDLMILRCKMRYSREIERTTTERVDARVLYDSNYDFGVYFPMMNEAEMAKKKIAGTLEAGSTAFTYDNEEISTTIELSENPVIQRSGKDNYIYFTIKNTGSGYIENIPGGDVTITSVPSGIITDCDTPGLLIHDSGTFTKITCKLNPSGSFQNVNVFMNVRYTYELRRSGTITVKK